MTKANTDWTVDPTTGRCNTSEIFKKLEKIIGRIIRGSSHDLIMGRSDDVAGLILAKLAHEHGVRPSEADMSLLRGLEPLIPQLAAVQTKITCLADIERLVAEDVKQSGKPGPRVVTIGTHTRQILEALSLGRGFAGGTLDLPSGQTIIIRIHHAEQYLSVERVPEEKEQITALIHPSHKTGIEDHYPFGSAGRCTACGLSWRSGQVNPKLYQQCNEEPKTTQCCFCKATDTLDRITITSEHHGWSKLGTERAHSVCANTWRELTAGNRTDLLCAVLCDFYYSTEGMTNLEHYADQLCETLLQLGLIYQSQKGSMWSAFYITDLGKAFFKKVLVAPWYKATTLKVQVDRLTLYAVNAGLTPHWLYLGRKQQQELDAWIPASTSRGPVSKFSTSGGLIEVIRIRKTDDMFLHGYTQTQPGVKEYSEAITLEDVANQK